MRFKGEKKWYQLNDYVILCLCQALWRGYIVRKQLLSVRKNFQDILLSLYEGDDVNSVVSWKSQCLCKPSILPSSSSSQSLLPSSHSNVDTNLHYERTHTKSMESAQDKKSAQIEEKQQLEQRERTGEPYSPQQSEAEENNADMYKSKF